MDCIFDEYIKFVENFLINYFKLLLSGEYERNLIRPFIDRYIDVRYFNKFSFVKEPTFTQKLNKELNNVAKEVMSENEDKVEKVKNIFALFGYVLYIDGCFSYSNISTLTKSLFNDANIKLTYSDKTKAGVTDLIREFTDKKNEFFKLFDTDEFFLKGKKLESNMYCVDLGNNCHISKLYSSYAIERAYNSEVVMENRLYLMLVMLTTKILAEAISLNFENSYVVDFPETLLEKQKKIMKYLKLLDNDLLRNKVILRFKYSVYKNRVYKKEINKLINNDYNVSIILDDAFDSDFDSLVLFTNIFVDKKGKYYQNVIDNKEEYNLKVVEV